MVDVVGKAGSLLLEEWKEAETDGWIDPQGIKDLSAEDQELVKALKITYMAGKGNRHIVSLLIPDDCVQALRKLADSRVRRKAGIREDNHFLFATQASDLHLKGWHALKDVCNKLVMKSPELINATNNRHRISTIFASMSVPVQLLPSMPFKKPVRDTGISYRGGASSA